MKGITVCCDGEKSLKKELALMEASNNKEENAIRFLQLLWRESSNKKTIKKKPSFVKTTEGALPVGRQEGR